MFVINSSTVQQFNSQDNMVPILHVYIAKSQNTFVMFKISAYASSDQMIVDCISPEFQKNHSSPNFGADTSLADPGLVERRL